MADKLPYRTRRAVLTRDQEQCQKCRRTQGLHVHHITARVDGGADTPDNLITLCATCHAEWHMAESAYHLAFDAWLQLPTYDLLVAVYRGLPADLRQATDITWSVRRYG